MLTRNRLSNERGFSLIEILSVVTILSIQASIAGLSLHNLRQQTEEDVCLVNREQLLKWYHDELVLEGLEHSEESGRLIVVCMVREEKVRRFRICRLNLLRLKLVRKVVEWRTI